MIESPTRWKTNGLPRKGWTLLDVVDEGFGQECEWCGTAIRYVHYIFHPETNQNSSCGCVCAEHLTEDYVTGRKRESKLKQKHTRLHRFLNSPRWYRLLPKYNLYRLDKRILIYKKNNHFMLKIHDLWGKKKYSTEEEAKIAAFNYLFTSRN